MIHRVRRALPGVMIAEWLATGKVLGNLLRISRADISTME